ncbi:solute-binding protein [Pseudonocardia sulfidoxydans NBRC 16205]|uniref:Solute-binding protein n=1 Tax=Pseudonocardia sulfidoxydans NBRC 16205 TaxID=1223511 RepID=A0A511DE65_9PSEU|nr:ABC transporter substrate-binding protein [Pseudonocardia sulfidoxydans]GEL23099.1 solute-binding protein [Pseudonocardia sulfidoxydans NBRC 16205]
MSRALSRRQLLRYAGVGAGLAAAVTACGSPASAPTVVGSGGGGAAESLDPFISGTPSDYARNWTVFDELFAISDGNPLPRLAVGVDQGDGAFTVRLRDGVTWHDGSPFVADDVAYTLRYLASPERPVPHELTGFLDTAQVQVRDPRTITIPTLQPVGDPAMLFAGAGMRVIKDGATFAPGGTAVGTGPYRLGAFEPGRQARLTRYDAHWDGAPFADEIVVISLDDPSARVNAVRTGEADYAADVPFTVARTGAGGDDLEVRSAGDTQRTSLGFVMNTTIRPFDDPRARRAVRMLVDRQALVDRVLLGYGVTGNDLFGHGARYFDDTVKAPATDVAGAKALLEQAGAVGAPLVVRSAEYEAGMNGSTELFVEQLKAAGLDARAEIVGVQEYFAPDALAATHLLTFPLGPFPLDVTYARSAAFPTLALNDAELKTAVATAFSTPDEAARAAAWKTAQAVMADRGNWIVWGLADTLAISRRNVAGIEVRDSAKYPYLGKAGLA